MAPSNGIRTNDRNGQKARIQPVIPALPMLSKNKKNSQQAQNSYPVSKENPQTKSPATEKLIETNENESQKSLSKAVEGLNGQFEISTPSVSALDESVSIYSSQEHPSPAIEQDSSVTSIVTSESVEPSASEPKVPIIPPADALDQYQTRNTREDGVKTLPNGFGNGPITRHSQENGILEESRVTPDSAPLMTDISPLTHMSSDKVAVELSAHATPVSTAPIHPEVSPEVTQSFGHRHHQAPAVLNRSYPEVAQNGHQSVSHRTNISNGHHSTASLPKPLPTVLEHLLFLANSKQLADWAIRVDQPGLNVQAFVTYAHAFVLLRSDRMRKLMAQPLEPSLSLPLIRIAPARAIQPHAFEAALRFLYSDTVLSMEALLPPDTYMDRHARAHVVDYVLSYWVAGIELSLDPISSRAYSLLAGMVDWDIAELLVREALSLRSLASSRPEYQASAEPAVMGESVLRLVLGLFLHRFDAQHFKLDTNCQPAIMSTRFAVLDQARTPSNPVLAGMVFGSMPTSTNLSPNSPVDENAWSADTVASSILLNLEFADLNNLSKDFIRTYGSIGAHVISEVVKEREKRRLQLFHNTLVSNNERTANPDAWEVVGWQESFDHGNLHRERVGYVLSSKKIKTAS